jgi:hypothetical protein
MEEHVCRDHRWHGLSVSGGTVRNHFMWTRNDGQATDSGHQGRMLTL